MKSVLLIGQSNMAGRGFTHEVPPIYNERIMMLRNGRWQMMTEPIHLTNEKELVDKCHNRMNTSSEKTYIALEKFTLGKISYEELMKAFS